MKKLKIKIHIAILSFLFFGGAEISQAAVLWSSNAEHLACGQGESSSVWDYTGSGDSPDNRFYARCATPVPNSGRSNYYQVDAPNLMHDAWNVDNVSQINLSTSTTYYLGGFFRFDRINSNDIWEDGVQADSYDKLYELRGNVRALITAGWNNGYYDDGYDHQFTFGLYLSPAYCANNCNVDILDANVSPYGRANAYACDYGRWYAVVMAINPSSGNGAQDGLMELYINGTKTTSLSQSTQDSATPYIDTFQYSGTIAQPDNNAPAHMRKLDGMVFANSLVDMTAAGLMEDPESGGGSDTTPPSAPSGLSVL